MRTLVFIRKELVEGIRSRKIVILAVVFVLFGIMNPAIAKLTPWMMEMMSDQLAEVGIPVPEMTVDANASWMQFFKNIPLALIIYVLMCGGIFTKEYRSGTLGLLFTKGLKRYEAVAAKTVILLLGWTVGYALCFGITYGYNAYFWDNSIVEDLMQKVIGPWLCGLFVLSLAVFFSALANGLSGVLLGTAGSVIACSIISMIPKVKPYIPTTLMDAPSGDILKAVTVTVVLSVILLIASVPIMNKRSL